MSNPDWTEAPDDATHWDTRGAVWCKFSYFWCYGRWNYEGEIHDLAEDRYTPRPVEPAIAAWDGIGFPPVGTVCEVVIAAQMPRTVWFMGIKSSGSVVIETVDGELKSYHRSQVNFRPIRSQAQIERTLLTKTLNCMRKETDVGVIADAIIEIGFGVTKS